MNRVEFFTYNNQTYSKGTIIYRKERGMELREIFLWRTTPENYIWVISPGSYRSTSGVPRRGLPYDKYCSAIVRFDKPTAEDMQQVAKIDAEFSSSNKTYSDSGLGLFLGIFLLGIGTLIFPPIGIIAIIYAFLRK